MKKVQKNQVNRNLLFFGLGFVCIVTIVGLVLNLSEFSTTGAATHIEYYGISDKLMVKAGTLQTFIDLEKPVLRTLSTPEGRLKVAQDIVKVIDFESGIAKIYQNKPYATISAGSMNSVKVGAAKESTNFVKDLSCLKKMGANLRNRAGMKLSLISELKYAECRNKLGWHAAYLQHSYFDNERGGIICRQDNPKLFAVNDKNGNVMTDVTAC